MLDQNDAEQLWQPKAGLGFAMQRADDPTRLLQVVSQQFHAHCKRSLRGSSPLYSSFLAQALYHRGLSQHPNDSNLFKPASSHRKVSVSRHGAYHVPGGGSRWEFPKIGGYLNFGVLRIRILLFRAPY